MTEVKERSKTLLFLSSFTPLWVIFVGNLVIKNGLLIFEYPINNIKIFLLEWGFLIILGISIISTISFLIEIRTPTNLRKVTIYDRENVTGEYVLYVVTYIIPFLINNFENEQLFSLIVMLLFIGVLYVRASLVHVNPMLALFGYRLYAITDEKLNKVHVLATHPLYRDDEISISMIDSGFFVEIKQST